MGLGLGQRLGLRLWREFGLGHSLVQGGGAGGPQFFAIFCNFAIIRNFASLSAMYHVFSFIASGLSILHACWMALLSLCNYTISHCYHTTIILSVVHASKWLNGSYLCYKVMLQCVSVDVQLSFAGVPQSPPALWHHHLRHWWFPLSYNSASVEKVVACKERLKKESRHFGCYSQLRILNPQNLPDMPHSLDQCPLLGLDEVSKVAEGCIRHRNFSVIFVQFSAISPQFSKIGLGPP